MRLIDANKLMLWLNDVWYSSFKYEESPTSIAVKEAMKAITEYVNTQTDVEPSGDLISRDEAIKAIKKRMGNKPLPPTEICTYFECIDEIKTLPSADITETETCQRCQDLTDTILNRQGDEIKRLKAEARPTGEWIPVSDIRKLEDVVYMHIDSLEGTRNIVEAGMLSAWKEVAEYVDGMLGEDGEA